LIALAEPVIIKLYKPQFAPAIPVLQILLVSLIFGFMGFVTGATLNATNRQRVQTGLLAVVLVINIILNLILLPKWGIVGAAVAVLISNIVLCLGGYWFCKKVVAINQLLLLKYFAQTFFPAGAMALLAWWLSARFHFILIIPVSAILYLLLLLWTGAFDKNLVLKFYYKIFPKKNIV